MWPICNFYDSYIFRDWWYQDIKEFGMRKFQRSLDRTAFFLSRVRPVNKRPQVAFGKKEVGRAYVRKIPRRELR